MVASWLSVPALLPLSTVKAISSCIQIQYVPEPTYTEVSFIISVYINSQYKPGACAQLAALISDLIVVRKCSNVKCRG